MEELFCEGLAVNEDIVIDIDVEGSSWLTFRDIDPLGVD
jgi:hypothetical protein